MSQNALQYFPCSSEPLKPDPGLKASGGHESKRGPKKVRRKTPQNAAKRRKTILVEDFKRWLASPKYFGISRPFCSSAGSSPVVPAIQIRHLPAVPHFSQGQNKAQNGHRLRARPRLFLIIPAFSVGTRVRQRRPAHCASPL